MIFIELRGFCLFVGFGHCCSLVRVADIVLVLVVGILAADIGPPVVVGLDIVADIVLVVGIDPVLATDIDLVVEIGPVLEVGIGLDSDFQRTSAFDHEGPSQPDAPQYCRRRSFRCCLAGGKLCSGSDKR